MKYIVRALTIIILFVSCSQQNNNAAVKNSNKGLSTLLHSKQLKSNNDPDFIANKIAEAFLDRNFSKLKNIKIANNSLKVVEICSVCDEEGEVTLSQSFSQLDAIDVWLKKHYGSTPREVRELLPCKKGVCEIHTQMISHNHIYLFKIYYSEIDGAINITRIDILN